MSDDLTFPARDDARAIWVFTAALDAEDFTDFAIAIRRKLVREIAGPVTAGLVE